ncbi:retrotransposon protein, putative, ty1-copia subclass [Tanacetum coccineum]
MTRNIISFHALFKDGYKFSFNNDNGDILVYSNGCFMFKASPCKGIYETIECISHNDNVILNVGSSNELDKSKLWHSRLGHINKKRIAQLQKDGVLESFDFKSDDVCVSCLLGKMTKSSFIGSCERGEGLLDLVYTDVCGPFRYVTKDGKRYYVMFTDDFSKYGYVYLIKHKSNTFEVFKRYQNESSNTSNKLLGLRITYILNLEPTKKVSKTPFKMWKGKRPSLKYIKIWGCEVFVRREAQDKLEARSEKCLFIGYPEESFGYLFYKPKDNVVFVARRGVFLEREMISKEDSGKDNISDSTLNELDEPTNYKEAMASPKAAK